MTNQSVGAQPRIKLEHLYFAYEEVRAGNYIVEDFSLDIHDREFVSIVGPSGCGKTTLLNMIAGLLPPTSGQILVDGVRPERPGPDRTLVFQSDAIFPWYTVAGNIEYGLKAIGKPRKERKETVNRLLQLVGLEADRKKFPRQLSGGMRKRVDIARAMAVQPEVLLMDEPFAALDVLTKERLQQDFLDIWQTTRVTVVFVTHDLEEALFLSQRVVVMSRNPGRVEKVVDVTLPHPRRLVVKTTPEFQAIRRDLIQVMVSMHGGLEARE
jgi:ABC-type nitrate/sulfonate/bicarbonate transport system ATPase subunit